MNNLKIRLGRRIKNLRKSKNITQEKLAEIISMDITSLSKIETGRNYPQPETVEKLANALNVSIDKLFLFKDDFSKEEYLNEINNNIKFISNDINKLKILYSVSSSLI
ncbi:MAG: helix-turn-helix transcriptional regulator [Candidatus Gastranaerophilaceae bacterium]|nr:helix-turn-helix transcriptional regulator [Candidatus Gastranaerophilaceae bacterium]